jgi:hypothetical protein
MTSIESGWKNDISMALDDDFKSAGFGSSTPKILKIRVNIVQCNDNKLPRHLLEIFYISVEARIIRGK